MVRDLADLASDSWFLRFHDLMPYRVREVLLVSSAYDAFTLEEDGTLTERLFLEYSELNLHSAPRITHAPTQPRALELMRERRFDLVLTTARGDEAGVAALAGSVKAIDARTPVALLAFEEAELRRFRGLLAPGPLDQFFVWTGDARILLAIIKLIEDERNAPPDTRAAGVQVLLVVEDSVRRSSTFLAMLYSELMKQSQSLIAEGLNDLHRLFRMRARPKILLASSFEEAMEKAGRYRDYLLGLISDVRFPWNGQERSDAGFALFEAVRKEHPDLPVLLQSAESANAARAEAVGAAYADKNSPTILRRLREFLLSSLGFGDFIFRLPNRVEVGRAKDMYELRQILKTVHADSVAFHASRHHFNVWLRARCMFRVADLLKSVKLSDFADVEDLRRLMLEVLEEAGVHEQEGVIADFSRRGQRQESALIRLSSGSLGGKGRGIAFIHSTLARYGLADRFDDLEIRIPKTLIVGTDEFDRFIDRHNLPEALQGTTRDDEILKRFLAGRLSEELRRDLQTTLRGLDGPLAVRSSSLLEDARRASGAGIYATAMVPNNHPDLAVRVAELEKAICTVYASSYSNRATAYLHGTGVDPGAEKMAVVVQEVVGRRREDRFYPSVSGVALSYNFYPVGRQEPEGGIALLALGLGHAIVSGENVVRFSPAAPGVQDPSLSPKDRIARSQQRFYAIDLSRQRMDFLAGAESSLGVYDLAVAERDGALALAGSVYSASDEVVRENLSLAGPRLVTFNNILKWNAIPLAEALNELLIRLRGLLGCGVEIEFALETADSDSRRAGGPACLYVLQVRPLTEPEVTEPIPSLDGAPEQILCRSDRSLGHGFVDGLRDLVYVRRNDVQAMDLQAVSLAIGKINADLSARSWPYILIGPGRWGSSDPTLGVPVDWSQISGARVLVETPFSDRTVEPSQGSHFFHNLVTQRIGYLSVEDIDLEWLEQQPARFETSLLRHVHLAEPVRVVLDGKAGTATIFKP